MCVSIYARDLAALIFGVNVIGISGIGEHPEPVAVVHVFPLRVGDAPGILRFAHEGTIVLQAAIHAIGIVIVEADMIELGHRQVTPFPPFASAIIGIPHPAVVADKHNLRVGGIDPHIMRVPVRP